MDPDTLSPRVGGDGSAGNAAEIATIHDAVRRRQFGAYYTPTSAADLMAAWILRKDSDAVLEPSYGDGSFVRALCRVAVRRAFRRISIHGVELDERASLNISDAGVSTRITTSRGDFLAAHHGVFDGVIGNPPYVRIRNLSDDQRTSALNAASAQLGTSMEPSGSVWMPFVLHATSSLKAGGRMALVLPFEFTYVRYALPLWTFLSDHFGSLRVMRSRERLFPDVMQEVVVLFADGFGSSTDTVSFEGYDTLSNLLSEDPSVNQQIDVQSIVSGRRVFIEALLDPRLTKLIEKLRECHTVPLSALAKIRIGYVAGDKSFFHPLPEDIEAGGIRPESVLPALTSTKSLRRAGLRTSSVPADERSFLFRPTVPLAVGEATYVASGVASGVAARYKCRVRKPWYVVPGVDVPDVVMSVFSERPLLMLNDAGLVASNSLICGFLREGTDACALIAAWYTSLTLLQCELEVHALGGGVMVLIPGEANKIRVPSEVSASASHLETLDLHLRKSEVHQAYASGDGPVLQEQLGLTREEIGLIHAGITTLTKWRTAHRA